VLNGDVEELALYSLASIATRWARGLPGAGEFATAAPCSSWRATTISPCWTAARRTCRFPLASRCS